MKIDFCDYSVDFGEGNGGFPLKISQYLRNGRIGDVVHTDSPWLTVKLADGRCAVPRAEEAPLMRRDDDGTAHIQYSNISFFADGEKLSGWKLSLEYELIPDGNAFIETSFQAIAPQKPAVESFKLRIPMDFGYEDDVTYGYWPRPRVVDPTGISAVGDFIRNLTEKKERTFDWTLPVIAFDFGRKARPSRHIEWLMEDQMSLDGGFDNVGTKLLWENAGPVVEYEFATKGVKAGPMPYYWREKIGFNLGQTPKIRDKAPLRMYHCIDAFENIPTIDRVRQMAAEGTDVLALHDACWRGDIRNGGNPYVQQEFIDMVAECHRHGIRVAPYFRGSEESAREDACSWFDFYLKKNYDGLYSDYGAAFSYHEVNDACPAGRISFKQHYRVFKAIRERTIGQDGILDIHTGPFLSSAVISSLADGYLSGEGERGAMLRSRRDNAYFSAATVAPGALWTAEFPEYRSEKMLPFLANLGQYPHVIIGEQRKSASVAHPMEPQNVTFARPLWKLFGLMKDERKLRFDNDLCDESITCDSYDTGLSVFTMQDGARLYFLSNFADERLCSTNARLFCRPGEKCYRLNVNYEQCSIEVLENGAAVEAELKESGICGFLVCPVNEKWAARLAEFEKPYPELFPAAKAYEKRLEDTKIQRFTTAPWKTIYMKVDAPYYPGALEIQFLQECYENTNELFATDENGNTVRVGYLSKLGLTASEPPISECLWPGEETDWIPLHEHLTPGRYHMEVHCTYGGSSTTQRYHILLSENKDPDNARDVTFYLALDADKSRLSFDVERG